MRMPKDATITTHHNHYAYGGHSNPTSVRFNAGRLRPEDDEQYYKKQQYLTELERKQ